MSKCQHKNEFGAVSQPGNPINRPERLYRLKDVLRLIPISKSSWFSGIQQGKYPPGHLLSERTRVWKSSEIQAIIDNLD